MSMLDKFRRGAQRAGIQATALVREGSSRVASGSRDFVQGFTLPGEAEKAAKILASFLGQSRPRDPSERPSESPHTADPNHPQSALNSIPKAVLQHARGMSTSSIHSPIHTHPTPTCRPRRLPGDQSRLHVLRKSRLGPRHRPSPRRLLVRPIVHRHGWSRLGPPNRRRHHRLCHRPQLRGRRPCLLHRRERHHWGERERRGRAHRDWRECPGELGTPREHVFVLQVQRFVVACVRGWMLMGGVC